MAIRRSAFVVAILAVAAAGGLVPASGASASVTTTRLAGTDRYDTAAVIAEAAFPGGNGSIVLGSGASFADALAGAYYAGVGTPSCPQSAILLTAPDTLPAATQKALTTLKATKVTILGGTSAVSANVASQLQSMGLAVSRIGGANRYATMLALDTACGLPSQKLAFVASGTNYPDALAAAGASYGRHIPMVLTDPGSLSPEASIALTKLGITQVVVLGGASAVSAVAKSALTALGISIVQNFAGVDRSDTSVQLARWEIANLGFSTKGVALARGNDFADALVGAQLSGTAQPAAVAAAHAGGSGEPTLEITPDNVGTAVTNFLGSDQPDSITVLGGTNSVTNSAAAAAAAAAGGGSASSGGWSVTSFSPNQIYLQGQAGQPFTISGTFPGAAGVTLVEAGDNPDPGNVSLAGCNPSNGADAKVSQTTRTTITGLIVLPDSCPPGPYDVLVEDASAGGAIRARINDAFIVLPAVVSIAPTQITADGGTHTIHISGRAIRPSAFFCLAPPADRVNAGTPCKSLVGAVSGTLENPDGLTIFDVDFKVPTSATSGSWSVVVDSSALKGGVGTCAGCLSVQSGPSPGFGLRTLTFVNPPPKLGTPLVVAYSGGLFPEADEISVTDPANFSYGCTSDGTISVAGQCTIAMPSQAMIGQWVLAWSWSGSVDPRSNPCAADLTYIAPSGSLPAECVMLFQIG